MSAITWYAVKRADSGHYADGSRGWDEARGGAFRFRHAAGMKRDVRGAIECGAADHAETFDGMLNDNGEPADVHVVRIVEDGGAVAEERI